MAEKLSRMKRYQDLRDRLDEETTIAQEDKSHQESGFARLSRTQHKALSHANNLQNDISKQSTSYIYEDQNTHPVMDDLLGEVKQYNIEKGNRYIDDTQINILHQLDKRPSENAAPTRNRHIVPMEEEDGGSTMKINRNMEEESVATYLPNQKLTRINPVLTKPSKEEAKDAEKPKEDQPVLQDVNSSGVYLGKDDILVDDTIDTDHLSLFNSSTNEEPLMEEPKEPVAKPKRTSKSKTKSKKKAKKEASKSKLQDDIPSAKIRMSTRDIEDMETPQKNRSNVVINAILIILILALVVSIGFVVYFLMQLGG